MKIFRLLVVILMLAVVLSGCGTSLNESLDLSAAITASTTANDISSTEYMLITENEELAFWFNKDTTAFKVVDKSDGYEWYSSGLEQQNTESSAPFTLSYVNESGLIETMDAMTACIADGQYKYERTDNGLKVTYSLGEYVTDLDIPLALTKERMESVTDNIEDDFKKSQFETMYQYIDIKKLDDENKKNFLNQYPKLEDGPLYILRDRITASNDKMKELSQLLQNAGYTEEMFEEDKEYFVKEDSGEKKETPRFRVQIVYALDSDGFTVTVPDEEIQMSAAFPVLELELLKYFGSPKADDEGYFLLPDGSGSIMNFYNGRGDLQNYSISIYGIDYSAADTENIYQCDQAYLPIYGIKNGTHAMFSVIEKGDAITTLNAYTGNEQLAAYAAPTFKLRSYYKSYMRGSNTASNYFVSMQNERYKDDIVVRYKFLNGDNASYSGMAKWYSDYLFNGKTALKGDDVGVVVECIGQIEKTVKALGINYNERISMTDFKQVKEIATQLNSSGIDKLSIKMSGWWGGSYRNEYAGKLSLNRSLGTEKEFKELAAYLSESGIGFYPDADLQYTYKTSAFDKFSTNNDIATLCSKSKGYRIDYNPATFCRDSEYSTPVYINTPAAIKNAFEGFMAKYKTFGIKGISLRNVGRNLDGDYNDDNGTDRQKAANMLLESLRKVSESNSIMTNGANAYVLNCIDYCCDVPLESNRRDNTDESVPFLEMVISGNVRYSGPAINLSGDAENCILDMAAVAADAYYTVTAENFEETRDSDYSFLYSTDFSYIKEDMVELLSKYRKDMEGLSGQRITDYKKLSQNLYRTFFADGSTVTVNYDIRDITVDGVTYAAKSYTVERKEG